MAHSESDKTRQLREQLVDELLFRKVLSSERVASALREVPRHVFLSHIDPASVYRDEAFLAKSGPGGVPVSGSTQPAITAIMLEQLDARPGQRVLEIGAGTGYNAALLAHLVGEAGSVVTVDIEEDLVLRARERLAACGFGRVTVGCGDGASGWPTGAPYDRIILTAGAWDLAPAWLDQLVPDGRLVLPLALCRWVQYSIAFVPANGHLESAAISPCGTMRLRGAFGGPGVALPLDGEPGIFAGFGERREVDTRALGAAMRRPGDDEPTGVLLEPAFSDEWDGLELWLAITDPDIGRLMAVGPASFGDLVPAFFSAPGLTATDVLLGADGCAVLARREHGDGAFEVTARPFGAQGGALARRLAGQVRAWQARGRLSTAGLRVSAYPASGTVAPAAALIMERPNTRLALTWPAARQAPGVVEDGALTRFRE